VTPRDGRAPSLRWRHRQTIFDLRRRLGIAAGLRVDERKIQWFARGRHFPGRRYPPAFVIPRRPLPQPTPTSGALRAACRSGQSTLTCPARSRTEAARDAGISSHQGWRAIQVSNIPAVEFEAAIESEKPATDHGARRDGDEGGNVRNGDYQI
jgi:hypothetical protein